MASAFIILTLIFVVFLGSLILLFFRRSRKAGIRGLGTLLGILFIAAVYIYFPRNYPRNYIKNSMEWKRLNLRQYSDSLHFYIGAIPGELPISDPLFYLNFNSVTPERALKMGPLLRNFRIGEYDFSEADKLVNMALAQGIRARGHTLVWGKQSDLFKSPDLRAYLERFPDEDRSRILNETVENHIITVLNHYKGRVNEWDVVNEPMSVMRPGKLEDNVFMKYLGEEYIASSFRLAHSVDPDLKLFLNENFISYKGKTADSFIELVKKLKEEDVPLHGIGIQGHISSVKDTSVVDLQNFMKRITDMGLDVEITELDARLRFFSGAKDPYEAQGKYYSRLIKACMSNPKCKGVTFWGFSDDLSWQDQMPVFFPKPNEPYLYDANLNPKPAYHEVYLCLKKVAGY